MIVISIGSTLGEGVLFTFFGGNNPKIKRWIISMLRMGIRGKFKVILTGVVPNDSVADVDIQVFRCEIISIVIYRIRSRRLTFGT